MRVTPLLALLVTAIACSLFAASAQAERARVFVASYGSDSNPCTFGSPCKTFQNAVSVVADHGEVTAIDSAGFGPVTITNKSVTISSPDGVEAGIAVASGDNGITINAGSTDTIVLRGLTIDGAGVGYNGIVFNSGGNLVVKNCVLQDFVGNDSTGNGILIAPASGTITFTIVDTIVTNSVNAGILYLPPSGSATATGVIDHVVVTGSENAGIAALGLASGGSAAISISNSVISNNTENTQAYGVVASRGSITMTLDNDEISYNFDGIENNGGTMVLGRSTITNNSDAGIYNGGTIDTFLNNQIYANGNSNAVGGAPLINVPLQ
jgi:hypothetical protein